MCFGYLAAVAIAGLGGVLCWERMPAFMLAPGTRAPLKERCDILHADGHGPARACAFVSYATVLAQLTHEQKVAVAVAHAHALHPERDRTLLVRPMVIPSGWLVTSGTGLDHHSVLQSIASNHFWHLDRRRHRNTLILSVRDNIISAAAYQLKISEYRVLVATEAVAHLMWRTHVQFDRDGVWMQLEEVNCSTRPLVSHAHDGRFSWYVGIIRLQIQKPIVSLRLDFDHDSSDVGRYMLNKPHIHHIDLTGEVIPRVPGTRV